MTPTAPSNESTPASNGVWITEGKNRQSSLTWDSIPWNEQHRITQDYMAECLWRLYSALFMKISNSNINNS